jgi:membrane-bound ClpP family serine protease
MFTTPRGAIEITAQPVARDLVRRLTNLAILLGFIVVGVIAYRIFRQLPLRQATGTMAFAILVALLGFLSLLARFLPWIGLVLLVVGVVLIVRRVLDRRPAVVVQTETAL